MSQLYKRENEVLRGYEYYNQDNDITFRWSHTDMMQLLLHLLSTEIVLNIRLHMKMYYHSLRLRDVPSVAFPLNNLRSDDILSGFEFAEIIPSYIKHVRWLRTLELAC